MNTDQVIKEMIYKALVNRDTTGACRRPLESTEKKKKWDREKS